MPRPRIRRRIRRMPGVSFFKPAGVRMRELEEVVLSCDEYEVVRLIDFLEQEQGDACRKMNISQPTLSRLLKNARKKISEAIVKGKALRIKGGDFEVLDR